MEEDGVVAVVAGQSRDDYLANFALVLIEFQRGRLPVQCKGQQHPNCVSRYKVASQTRPCSCACVCVCVWCERMREDLQLVRCVP